MVNAINTYLDLSLKQFFVQNNPLNLCSCDVKVFFAVKNLVLNVGIKAFWYTKSFFASIECEII